MAVLAIAAVGAAIGYGAGAAAGYAALGASIGWAIGAYVGQRLFGPEQADIIGSRLEDLTVQMGTYGVPIPKVYGTARIAGGLIWKQDILEKSNKDKVGGKGGGGQTVISYSYFGTFAVEFCEGEIEGVGRIWLDGKLYADGGLGKDDAGFHLSRQRIDNILTIYNGSETQEADPTMEAYEGTDEVPGYRGTAYMVFNELPLKDYGNHIPNVTVEIFDTGNTSNPSLEIDMPDINPRGICMADDNLVTSDISTNEITVFDGLSETILFQFDAPAANPVGLTYMNGNLYILCTGDGGKIFKMRGLSATVLDSMATKTAYVGGLTHYQGDLLYSNRLYDFKEGIWWLEGDGMEDGGPVYRGKITAAGWVDNLWGLAVDASGNLLEGQPRHAPQTSQETIFVHDGFSDNIAQTLQYGTGKVIRGIEIYNGDLLLLDGGADDVVEIYEGISTTQQTYDRVYPTNESVQTVVDDILESCGVTSGLRDTSDVDSLLVAGNGYVRTKVMTARQALEPLMAAFLFDAAEMDHKIKFTERGGASAATISADDIRAHAYDETPGDALSEIINQEIEFPKEVNVTYKAVELDYQPGLQRSRRVTANGLSPFKVELPLSLTHTEAKQIAEIIHNILDVERKRYRFTTGIEYLYLAPTDLATVSGYLMRIEKMDIAGGLLQFECVAEEAGTYTSDAVAEAPDFPGQEVSEVGSTNAYQLDIPILRDADDDAGFYVGMHGYKSGWKGGVLFRSNDGGQTFSQSLTIINAIEAGYIETALADGPTGRFDLDNTIRVTLNNQNMTLSSITELAVLNGGNAAAIGSPGAWEIIQFQNATLISAGVYDLDKLLRGRRGTEWMAAGHSTGEQFVLLTSSGIRRYSADSSEIGTERIYRAVSIEKLLEQASDIAFTNTAVGLKPYSPVHVAGSRDGSNNLTITWVRRTRVAGEWRDNVGVPIGEESEDYEVDVYDNGTVVRTIDSLTSETASYTADQQTADGLTPGNPVHIKIYQLSATVGRGYAADATI